MTVATQTITRDDLRIYAFTRDHVMERNADHVFTHSPFLAIMTDKLQGDFGGVPLRGQGKTSQTGGAAVQVRVRLGKNSTPKRMSGPWDTHSTAPDDNTRLAEANWPHYSGALVLSDYDKAVNTGREAMASFVEDQTLEVMRSLADEVAIDLLTNSPATNALTSADALVSANDTVQGLAGATYTYYNSRGLSDRGTAPGSVSFASGSFTTQGLANLRTLYNNASEGSIQPNVHITDYASHERYEARLQPQERYAAPARTGDAAFTALAFRAKPVLADPNCPSSNWYMFRVGMDGLKLIVLRPFDFMFAPFKPGHNTESHVSELQFKGQLVIRNRQYGCNKMTGITD